MQREEEASYARTWTYENHVQQEILGALHIVVKSLATKIHCNNSANQKNWIRQQALLEWAVCLPLLMFCFSKFSLNAEYFLLSNESLFFHEIYEIFYSMKQIPGGSLSSIITCLSWVCYLGPTTMQIHRTVLMFECFQCLGF